MVATLVGLSMLLVLVAGAAILTGCLATRLLRARQARRHPERTATKAQIRQARRLAAEWPCSRRRCGWATPTSGPASTGTQELSSWSTARA